LLTGDQRLEVRHGGRVPTYLTRGSIVEAPDHAKVGRTIDVTTSVPQLSVARLVFAAPGPDVSVGDGETVEPGVVSVSGKVPDVPPGTYKLQVELTNGTDIIRSRARNVVVTGGTVPSPSPSTSATAAPPTSPSSSPGPVALAPTGSSGTGVIVAAAAAGVVLASLGALLLIRRRAARRYRHARSRPS